MPSVIPSESATCLIVRPDDNTRSMASRWNSGGYFDGRPIKDSFLWALTQNQVSRNRGQPHPTLSVTSKGAVDNQRFEPVIYEALRTAQRRTS